MVDEEYPEDSYDSQEELQDNFLDEQREAWEEAAGMNYPSARKPDSLFTLFKEVWRNNNSSKVANLDKTELGDLGISVRDCQDIAALARFLHHRKFAQYFSGTGEITLATSMAKKGWFTELFVTSKKFAHKGALGSNKSTEKQKWRLFSKNQPARDESQ